MTEQRHPSGWKVGLAFAAVYVLWGSNYLAIRVAALAMPPVLMMAVRSLLAGALLFGWARLREGARPSRREWASAAAVGTVLFLGCHGLLAWAERVVPSGIAALVLATIPVWMLLLDWAMGGPRPGARPAIGLALGLVGLVVLVRPSAEGGAPLAGLLALVASALAWAAGSLLSRRLPVPRSLVLASGMQLLCGGAALFAVAAFRGELAQVDAGALAPRALGALAYMVLVASIVCFTAYMWLLRVTTPARVGTYAFVNPVVALLVGWALGGEALDARTMWASLVIVAGVALVVTASRGGARRRVDDRAHVEGHDAGRTGGRVPGVPGAHRGRALPGHAGQPRREHLAADR